MSLNEIAAGGVKKKFGLMDQSFSRFAVRSVLAGVYLAVGTGFAGVVGNSVEHLAPGLGAVAFSMLFGLGLFAIVILGADLATGNMMFASYGAVTGQVGWGKAIWLVVVTTFFNLIGAAIFALGMGVSAKLGHMPIDHLIVTLSEGKLNKGPGGLLVEGMLANFVVNMAIVGGLFAKEIVSKFVVIVPIIACFVGLGLEHVIANFCLMTMALFDADQLPAVFDVQHIALNWIIVWVGNFIGGGLLIGGVYAWLNKGPEVYRD